MVLYEDRRTHECIRRDADFPGDHRGAALHRPHELPDQGVQDDGQGLLGDERAEEELRGMAQEALPPDREVQAWRTGLEVRPLADLPPTLTSAPQPGILKA